MDRRQALKSCVALSLGYTFVNNKAWSHDGSPLLQETSEYFSMTVNGISVAVHHAAGSYSYVNLDVTKPLEIVITALKPDFWKKGVEILPSRHGIRPQVEGNSIRFIIKDAAKLALSRPGDYYVNAPLLFLFGNASPSVRPNQTNGQKRIRLLRNLKSTITAVSKS